MWPYDYLSEYSSLINEFFPANNAGNNRDRHIFIATYLKDSRGRKLSDFVKRVKLNFEIDLTLDIKPRIEDKIKYNLKALIPSFMQGDLNIEILKKIAQASLIICNITPDNFDNKSSEKYCFNPNVMYELGLALAWKMPEQVIIVCDDKFDFNNRKFELPFDIRSCFVKKVNFDKLGIKGFLQNRIKAIAFEKHVLIKKIKNSIDHDSLRILTKRNGLIFTPDHLNPGDYNYHRELSTIRFLLEMGLFRLEYFPNGDWCYSLTDLGWIFMIKGISKSNLYPRMFAEFYRVAYWRGHINSFNDKKKEFACEFRIKWDFAERILKRLLSRKGMSYQENIASMFDEYCNKNNFYEVRKSIVLPWARQVRGS